MDLNIRHKMVKLLAEGMKNINKSLALEEVNYRYDTESSIHKRKK